MFEEETLVNHYVHGKGASVVMDSTLYQDSVVVQDTMQAIKAYVEELKQMKIFLLAAMTLLLFGCHSNDCGFPLDQVRYADKAEFDGETFYLYTRTVGWHNKVVFFELYDTEPSFNDCGKTSLQPLYNVDYDDYPENKYVKTMTLQPDKDEKLHIVYTTDETEAIINVYDVKFTQ